MEEFGYDLGWYSVKCLCVWYVNEIFGVNKEDEVILEKSLDGKCKEKSNLK